MGLFESIESLLVQNNGKLALDDLYSKLGRVYSKLTIQEFLDDNRDAFYIKGGYIDSKEYQIIAFLQRLRNLINQQNSARPYIFQLIAGLYIVRVSVPLPDDTNLEMYSLSTEEVNLLDRIGNLFDDLDESFFEHPKLRFKFSVRLFEFLLSNELKDKVIFSTPDSLVDLMTQLVPKKVRLKIYNPTAGMLKLFTAINVETGADVFAVASELNPTVFEYGKLMAKANGVDVFFANQDSLLDTNSFEDDGYDLVVCNPPLDSKGQHERLKSDYHEIALEIISQSIPKLGKSGVGIFLINDGVLFGEKKEYQRFRKEIVDSGCLKAIVSLPNKLFAPLASLKTSLLIFDKSITGNSVQFVDASAKDMYQINKNKSISLRVDKILDAIRSENDGLPSMVNEPQAVYGSKNSHEVSIHDIRSNRYTLKTGRYLFVRDQPQGEQYKSLKEIAGTIMERNRNYEELPYIRISDLNGQVISSPEGLEQNTTNTTGKLLREKAVLVGNVGGSFKPTYFDGSFLAEVSVNVTILKVDEKKAFAPYVAQELNADYVYQQMDLLATGSTTLTHIPLNDLLKVKLKVPSLPEQERIYKERIEFYKEQKLSQNKEVRTVSDEAIFKTIQHEIGNILKGPEGFFDLLPDFLDAQNISLNTPIVPIDDAESISEMIESSQNDISRIYKVFENMRGILFADENHFKPQKTDLRKYLEQWLSNEGSNGFVRWFLGVNDDYTSLEEVFVEIDTDQLEYVFRNLLVNAINHGKSGQVLRFIVNIEEEEEQINLHVMNNGAPFPASFSIEDYVTFGRKSGDSSGQGLGGYLINRVIRNHHGTIDIFPGEHSVDVEEGDQIESVPVNVHFIITIPKRQ